LSRNQLEGSIPEQFVATMVDVKDLDLSGNYLTGSLPLIFSELDDLEKLNLSGNRLSGSIPPQLSELDDLTLL
jgi:Leucine-rich repeat (LRR) protein